MIVVGCFLGDLSWVLKWLQCANSSVRIGSCSLIAVDLRDLIVMEIIVFIKPTKESIRLLIFELLFREGANKVNISQITSDIRLDRKSKLKRE